MTEAWVNAIGTVVGLSIPIALGKRAIRGGRAAETLPVGGGRATIGRGSRVALWCSG